MGDNVKLGFLIMVLGAGVVLSKVFFDVQSVWPLYTGTLLAFIGFALINSKGKDDE